MLIKKWKTHFVKRITKWVWKFEMKYWIPMESLMVDEVASICVLCVFIYLFIYVLLVMVK